MCIVINLIGIRQLQVVKVHRFIILKERSCVPCALMQLHKLSGRYLEGMQVLLSGCILHRSRRCCNCQVPACRVQSPQTLCDIGMIGDAVKGHPSSWQMHDVEPVRCKPGGLQRCKNRTGYGISLVSSTPGSAKIKVQCSICVVETFAIISGSNNLCFSKQHSED